MLTYDSTKYTLRENILTNLKQTRENLPKANIL
jgi:hypothetical protein